MQNRKDKSTKADGKSNRVPRLCQFLPKACQGGQWNPLTYDTVGIQFEFDFKLGGGLEIKPFILFNGDDLRNLDFKHLEAAAGISFEVSVGGSAEIAGFGSVFGSDETVLDQQGLQLPSLNASGCVPEIPICGKVSGSYDLAKKKLSSISYGGGLGQGVDVSYGQGYNSILAYGNGHNSNKGWWRWPFSNTYHPKVWKSPIP